MIRRPNCWAESAEFALNYAQDTSESAPVRFMRRGLKAALGFDFIHAWRNRHAILQSDVIWTHTEQEHLAVALVLLMNAKKGGAFRITKPELARLRTAKPKRFAVPANTLVVGDTYGFHARRRSTRPSCRIEIWASSLA